MTVTEVNDADAIAQVVANLRDGRVRDLGDKKMHDHALGMFKAGRPTVVNATAIYQSLVAKDDPIYLYEDHPCISPPWEQAVICYRNEHGNVIVMHSSVSTTYPSWVSPENEIDWDRVRWTLHTFVWVGGRSGQGAMPTVGPAHLWQFAIYDNGEPADLRWVQLNVAYPMEHWDMAHLVLLGALNFCNCRNVKLVEPARPRQARRRLERLGVQVHTINVLPVGSSSRGAKGDPVGGTPLTSVRGHFAQYGPEYDRGLLFGKLAGRFWIPQHARGDRDGGEVTADYVLSPAGAEPRSGGR